MVDNNVVEDLKQNDEIGLKGFDFKCFVADKGGVGKRRIELLSLFIDINEAMEWEVVESVGKDEHEGE